MARERAGKIMDEFGNWEFGSTALGVFIGAILHMLSESVFDSFLKEKYPEKYPMYSTAISAGIFTTVAAVLFLYGKKTKTRMLEYLGAGLFFVEIPAWLDLIRVSFEIKK